MDQSQDELSNPHSASFTNILNSGESIAARYLVRFANVQKTYDGNHFAVRDLNLDIRRGEFLTLLGPSGSGKTTTLMMLAGFESPSAGEILFDGKPITRTAPHRRNFGVVFQNYALFPHLTVAQNVAYPLTVRKVSRADCDRRVAKALELVRLTGFLERFPQQLSGGQQQRVALARALVFDPQLVLLDEPLGALDKQLREHMQVELKALHRQLGVTFVYVTHDQSEALTMSDRVAVFESGQVRQLDSVQKIYEEPVNRFVAGFVGDSTSVHGEIEALEAHAAIMRLPSGETLRGINVGEHKVNTPAMASIRPERIVVDSAAAGNTVDARVEDIIYFGDHLRLHCVVQGQSQAMVKLSLTAPNVPAQGSSVRLHFPAEHLRIYT